jgi:hypothetical protein
LTLQSSSAIDKLLSWWFFRLQESRVAEGFRALFTGSLVVRSVLQPFEESAFTMFSKAASSAHKKDGEE